MTAINMIEGMYLELIVRENPFINTENIAEGDGVDHLVHRPGNVSVRKPKGFFFAKLCVRLSDLCGLACLSRFTAKSAKDFAKNAKETDPTTGSVSN